MLGYVDIFLMVTRLVKAKILINEKMNYVTTIYD